MPYDLKARIIEMLSESRMLVQGQIELHSCIHSGYYSETHKACQLCKYGYECKWLYQNDEYTALEHKTTKVLIESLEFAEAYVDAIITRCSHDRRCCKCEACSWLRRSCRLLRELR
jgi:hypothetical protein